MTIALVVTLVAWVSVEASLLLRDLLRGVGSTVRDKGTRSLLVIGWTVAFAAATWVADGQAAGGWHLITGLALMWAGLAVRIWSVVTLGASFRTTVEIDADQSLVEAGPYRFVRHPSYTGVLLIALGYGLTLDNWLALAVLLGLAVATTLRRIAVEEAAMAEIMGNPYEAYRQHTKRLLPGLW